MAHADSHEAIKASTTTPTQPDSAVDIYVWKPGRSAQGKESKDQPLYADIDPAPSGTRLSTHTPWSRTWRIFLAGAIIGVAVTKAAELLLHPGHKTTKPKAGDGSPA